MMCGNGMILRGFAILVIGVLLSAVPFCAAQKLGISNAFALDNRNMDEYSGTLPPGETVIPESKVIVLGNVIIPSNSRLVVQKNVILKLDGSSTNITVAGEFVTQGIPSSPVIVTSLKDETGGDTNKDGQASVPAPGNWQGIVIGENGKLTLNNADIRYAVNGIGTSGHNTSISINKSKIVSCQQYGISIGHQGSQFEVTTSLIAKNGSGGVYLSSDSFTRPKRFQHCTISDNAGPGMYFSGCMVDIKSAILAFNRNGVSCGNSGTSELAVQYSDLYNPGWSDVSGITYNLSTGHNVLSDPLFVNRTENDYTLSANSPAIDTAWAEGIETDILLQPLYDDHGVANTGRGGCWFGDMGAYERQQDSHSVDLFASYIFSPKNPAISSGQTIELNWVVGNQGNLNATGTWTDKVFLSKDTFLGNDDIMIGQVNVTSGLAAGQSYEKFLSVVVPQTKGIRYLLLAVDADKQCDIANRNNNVTSAVKPVLIDLPVISSAATLNDSIAAQGWNYYLFNNPSRHNAKVLFQTQQANRLKIFAGTNTIPNLDTFEYSAVTEGGMANLVFPADTNDLIIGVYGETIPQSPSAMNLSVHQAVMAIQTVSTLMVGNKGKATLRIVGESLSPEYEFYLDNGQGKKVKATVMPDLSDRMRAYFLEFNLTGSPQGAYVLSVVDAEGLFANYPQSVTIQNNSSSPEFKAGVQLPGMVRPLFVANLKVTYQNKGLNDVYSPLLTLVGPEGTQWQLPGESEWIASSKCKFVALSSSGRANVIRPGQVETINVKMRLPSTYSAPNVTVKLLSQGVRDNDGSEREQDWVYEVTDPDIIAQMEAAFGRTQGDYILALGRCALRSAMYGELVYSADKLASEMSLSPAPQDSPQQNHVSLDTVRNTVVPPSGEDYIYDYEETQLYEWLNGKWVIPSPSKIFSGSTAILIHGWNATLDTVQWEDPHKEVLRDMARALKWRQVENVLGIGWNSRGEGVTPVMLENLDNMPIPGNYLWPSDAKNVAKRIPSVVEDAFNLLYPIEYGNRTIRIDPRNTHIIGHSHGAHVAGLLGNRFRDAGLLINRITALDASTENVHDYDGNKKGSAWGQYSAAFTEFYKSSVFESGTTPWGYNCFSVVPYDKYYDDINWSWPLNQSTNYIGSHGYPLIWFTYTIENPEIPFGYNWTFSMSGDQPSWNTRPQFEACRNGQPWIGMIRGGINVQCVILRNSILSDTLVGISMADGRLDGLKVYNTEEKWTYPGFWESHGFGKSDGFEKDLAKVVEFECKSISMVSNKNSWDPAESGQISITIFNNADNSTLKDISRIDAQSEIVSSLYLSQDNMLNLEADILLEPRMAHSKDDFVNCYDEKNIKKEICLPSKEKMLSTWDYPGDDVDGEYYLILDLCSTQNPDIKNYELYAADNIKDIPIRIDEDGFYADMGFEEKTLYLDMGTTSLMVGLTAVNSSPPDRIADGSIKVEWLINNDFIGEGVNISAKLNKGRYEIMLKLTDLDTEEESIDRGIVIVKDKENDENQEDNQTTPTRQPVDPEDKFGPAGYDEPTTPANAMKRFISASDSVNYRIEVWNEPTAILPAAIVSMEDTIDQNVFDVDSIKFTRIGFLKWDYPLDNVSVIDRIVDCRPEMNTLVHVTANVNHETGTIRWRFETLDPETGRLPADPTSGFLPPFNPQTGYELGWMEFKVDLLPGLPTGSVIANRAYGEFDDSGQITLRLNPAPKLGPWTNTIDAGIPTSHILPLPQISTPQFSVSWTGQDDTGGSGIASYDIYVSENNQPYTLWLNSSETTALFKGNLNSTYRFYSVARDNVGNREEHPSKPDASTTVKPLNPDVNKDKIVNLDDLSQFAGHWLLGDCNIGNNWCSYFDFNQDGQVDLGDFQIFSERWMKEECNTYLF